MRGKERADQHARGEIKAIDAGPGGSDIFGEVSSLQRREEIDNRHTDNRQEAGVSITNRIQGCRRRSYLPVRGNIDVEYAAILCERCKNRAEVDTVSLCVNGRGDDEGDEKQEL